MTSITTAEVDLLIIVAIGIAAGLAFRRYGHSWWSRYVAGASQSDVTCALVGIAGSFIGFHLGALLGFSGSPIASYLAAAIGAVVVLWVWPKIRA